MDPSDVTPRRVGLAVAYGVLGFLGTGVVGLVALNLLDPIQSPLYHAVYTALGPSGATRFAILGHFVVSGAVAVVLAALVGEYLSDRGANRRAFGVAVAAVALATVAFLAVGAAGLESMPVALVWVVAVSVGVPALLRFGYDVRSGGLPAFVGAGPVLAFLLLLAGIGLGWGWGYVVTAEEIPAGSVDGDVATFEDVPEVREDLFAASTCEATAEGNRRCVLQLRGYEHERTAARYLDRHGVRCAYQGGPAGSADRLVAVHDGTYYRVTCSAHGD